MAVTNRSFLEDLRERNLVSEVTPELAPRMAGERVTGYIGFDPSAASLHVGSLLPIMCLARLQRAGHHAIAIAGGGTGLIGDPSGKSNERQLLTREKAEENLIGIQAQLAHFLDFEVAANPARLVNNLDWLGALNLIDFLRDVGKHFRVNTMLKRESVERRLESEGGISFTEFTYQILQAYDFLVLYERYGCTLQMGGSDQWGNIVAGIDLISRVHGGKAHGLVFPLVTSSTGTKFGKTEAGAVWLDPKLTTPYAFYQFWLNTGDADASRYLRYFTWASSAEIAELEVEHGKAPEARLAQKKLAEEVTRMMHGASALARAQRISELLFGERMELLSYDEVMEGAGNMPTREIVRSDLEGGGKDLLGVLAEGGVVSSKGEGRRLVEGGGLYLNNVRISDPAFHLTLADAIEGRLFLVRKGRKDYYLLRVTP